MPGHLQGRLSPPTPHRVDSAEHAGWPHLVMAQLESFLQGPVPEGPDVLLTGWQAAPDFATLAALIWP
ncbi:MAG: hypothetical protein KBF65_10585 [Rubrivivax sp.]|jgi:hypothetical protein|nr:hypothetical protein [Betaproteobacteria bacterium]MBP6316987.1 hypothetical protein [Rubrivivax sp.]MBK7277505.1 hypothetical protein [Betaproteobacteria bacterium]MBK7460270.1 hypothetical protein [Betaproteobacteria bacterium]MBK7516186.1 hypothetical protein [Betaproteobacteria bacterium]